MEHVFGRYVECPYSVKLLFYNHFYNPHSVMNTIQGNAFEIWIKPPQNMKNTLYYDPTLGRDKVITVGQHFQDGSSIIDSSYIPCQELMYYVKDVYGNGFRELDFSKIGALRLSMGGYSIQDHGMSIRNVEGFNPDKFTECFANFPGRVFLSRVLRYPDSIYKGKDIQVVFRDTACDVYDKDDINQNNALRYWY